MQDIGVNPVVLSSDKFKLYVSELRTKSNLYKKNRAELNDLKTEYGILSRTLEILQAQEASQSEKLVCPNSIVNPFPILQTRL